MFPLAFLTRPALVHVLLSIPSRLASSRCVARRLRSLSNTYHNLCKSSNDFNRSSLAFHERPKKKDQQSVDVAFPNITLQHVVVVMMSRRIFKHRLADSIRIPLEMWVCGALRLCIFVSITLVLLVVVLPPLVLVFIPVQVCSGRLAPFSKN